MNKSESIVELSKALAKFQDEVKQPLKDANNPFFKSKYVPLENVVEAITDIAPGLGLSFTQWALNDVNGRVGVATMLMHESGEYIEFDPVFMKADKETAQGAGALITYLKRYSLSAVFGITSDQDDDGNAASGNKKLATAEEVGQLKANVIKFAQQNNGEATKVQEALNIKDYSKMTSEQVKFAQKTLIDWGLKND
ncbi:ERF family protein [Macrococcus sp. DPC7161]|uniref:ERF family protein n=1 Tax=Macrococcus sp. DPC7161 TaxID=2507060 RepID=UPI00100AB5D7|nr:ERF family protein [Macrococcus sp. DPC7161]RXK19058.1 single-stranded DNA-binding protein [Macrococcus sp. DPC7161]